MNVHIEGETRTHNIFTQQTKLLRLGDGIFHALNRKLVFPADIDVALTSANSVTCDEHTFDDAVRITLQDQAVFKGTWLAFISIADNIFLMPVSLAHKAPFKPSGETRSTAALKPGGFDLVNDFFRSQFQSNTECLVAIVGNVIFDVIGVDLPNVLKHDAVFSWQRSFAGIDPGNTPGEVVGRSKLFLDDTTFI